VGAIFGEYIGSSSGFGWMIAYASSFLNIARVMSCIFILLIVGIVLNYLLDKVEKYLLSWRATADLSMNYRRDT
jgi:NitT/TauT family transport system permease protein